MSNLYNIALTFIKGIGSIGAKNLIAKYKYSENIFKEKSHILAKVARVGQVLSNKTIKEEALRRADSEINFAIKNNIKIHYYLDPTYPYRLKECDDAPIILYQSGNIDLNYGHLLAVVGTRNITQYGKELTNNLISQIASYQTNTIIVSGLAYGVDGLAHRTAIKEDIPTIAVVAHGLDTLYPSQHKSLATHIIEKGGAIVTEYPSNTIPDAPNFVQRNRIIAGMSDATIVVESARKGGALLTAEAANSYNRDVFAFAGRVDDTFSEGCNNLIKNHQAQMITSADDIFKIMGWVQNHKKPQAELFVELTEEEQKVVSILRRNAISANELSREAGIPIQKLISILILLEFKGVVTALPGNIYKA